MLLTYLKRLNRNVPIYDWAVIRQEGPRGHSQFFLLIITEESLEPLKVCDNKLRLGVRHARVKVFQSSCGTDIDETSGMLEDMQLEVETEEAAVSNPVKC